MALNKLNYNFQPIDFRSGLGELVGNFREGQKMRNEAEFERPTMQANLEKTLAEASRAPFVGLSGAASQAYGIAQLEKQLGPNHPTVIQAKELQRLENEHKTASTNLMNYNVESGPARLLSPVAKELGEEEALKRGELGVFRGIPLSTEAAQRGLDIIGNTLLKKSTTPAIQQQALQAQNALQSLNELRTMIKPLTGYAGAAGGIQKLGNTVGAPFGVTTENYKQYQEAIAIAHILGPQIRQSFKDSITPARMRQIQSDLDTASWGNNPEIAERKLTKVMDLLSEEMGSYLSGVKSTEPYGITPQKTDANREAVQKALGESKDKPNITDEEIEGTAKHWGITPDQVRKRLKQKGLL